MKIALVSLSKCDWGRLPIGLLCIQAYLRKHSLQHEVLIIDGGFQEPLKEIIRGGFDLVGISSMTSEYETATQLGKVLRVKEPKLKIILGGTHISTLPSSFRPEAFDSMVIGEGEAALVSLISGQLVTSNMLVSLDDFPHLDYSSLSPAYFKRQPMANFSAFGIESSLMTSRGCPFSCVFCSSGNQSENVRYFSVDWVLKEIEILYNKGVRYISIFDEVFALSLKRVSSIASEIIKRGLHKKITFYCNARADLITPELLSILREMGCRNIFFGFESGSQEVLNYLKCGKVLVEDNKKAILLCNKAGIRVLGNCIIGSPVEHLSDFKETQAFIEWAYKHKVNRMMISVLQLLPGTPVWKYAKIRGVVSDKMDFNKLSIHTPNAHRMGYVSMFSSDYFSILHDRAMSSIHKFKWRKLRAFLRNSPFDTIRFALSSPFYYIKRMFNSTLP